MFDLSSLQYLIMGSLFGLSSGISPGPLLTLVITQTLKHNKKEGIKISFVPMIADIPIILIIFMIFQHSAKINLFLSLISFAGALFLFYLAYETFKTKRLTINPQNHKPASFYKGILTNLLNPHPYLFWIAVGVPVALKAYHAGWKNLMIYFLSFYILLVGSKIGIALLIEKSKKFISSRIYFWIMKILGITLLIFALFFVYEGIKQIKL